MKVLGADPRFDRKRIGIIGWSRGAGAALATALESLRRSMITDDLKFAAHVLFFAPAGVQYRDSATDRSPILALHGEADDYTPIAPLRDYLNWAQSMGNPVSLVTYPGTYHDFDVEGGFSGFARNVVVCDCDAVIDLSNGHLVRLDHKDNPAGTLDQFGPYINAHLTRGAHLAPNAAARADAVEKVHAFLKQNLGVSK